MSQQRVQANSFGQTVALELQCAYANRLTKTKTALGPDLGKTVTVEKIVRNLAAKDYDAIIAQ
ncbi:MAG TPA: hypothetical protein VK694_03370 [Verrucomicrobiae bacterium]|nr:hypothetical protein [Verrucomicrobiae bacterium]